MRDVASYIRGGMVDKAPNQCGEEITEQRKRRAFREEGVLNAVNCRCWRGLEHNIVYEMIASSGKCSQENMRFLVQFRPQAS